MNQEKNMENVDREIRKLTGTLIGIISFSSGFMIGVVSQLTTGQIALDVMKMVFVGIIAAMASFFLQFAYSPGHIFGWYHRMIETKFRDNPRNPFGFLANPLGLCAYCQNIWLAVIAFSIMAILSPLSWWWLLPSTFIAHISLTILDKLFWE